MVENDGHGGVYMLNKVEICGVNTSKLKVLKESEKIELLNRIKGGDKEARNLLVNGNLRLVLSVVQKFTNRGENLDDLFQVGCIGLIKSIDNFDTGLNVRFSTYAVPMNALSRKANERMLKMAKNRELVRCCGDLVRYEYGQAAADFIAQYSALKPRSAAEYNKKRAQGLPTWAAVARACGLTKWYELLEYCGLDRPQRIFKTGRREPKKQLIVHRYSDLADYMAYLDSLDGK